MEPQLELDLVEGERSAAQHGAAQRSAGQHGTAGRRGPGEPGQEWSLGGRRAWGGPGRGRKKPRGSPGASQSAQLPTHKGKGMRLDGGRGEWKGRGEGRREGRHGDGSTGLAPARRLPGRGGAVREEAIGDRVRRPRCSRALSQRWWRISHPAAVLAEGRAGGSGWVGGWVRGWVAQRARAPAAPPPPPPRPPRAQASALWTPRMSPSRSSTSMSWTKRPTPSAPGTGSARPFRWAGRGGAAGP